MFCTANPAVDYIPFWRVCSAQRTLRWIMYLFGEYVLHSEPCGRLRTFLESMFCTANPAVAASALNIPTRLKDNSVIVAMATPPIMGNIDKYTCGYINYIITCVLIDHLNTINYRSQGKENVFRSVCHCSRGGRGAEEVGQTPLDADPL